MPDQAMHDRESDQVVPLVAHTKKSLLLRVVTIITVIALPVILYLIWHPMASVSSLPLITQQNFSGAAPKVSSSKSSVTANPTANSGGDIQVYILGAVLHPGVYTLSADARVYQLLLAAGGPSPKADLVTLNLAAKLNDGQEIYVTSIGESPPTLNSSLSGTSSSSSSSGSSLNQSLVNINTASADELRQKLSITSKTAQSVVSYRQQHGPFTSVDQLLQVVSKSIYDKIKDKVTV
jgi:competence protein ComEA